MCVSVHIMQEKLVFTPILGNEQFLMYMLDKADANDRCVVFAMLLSYSCSMFSQLLIACPLVMYILDKSEYINIHYIYSQG